ncbi:3'-5' exoribonuclease [Synechococcus phage MinM1]|nr:3'-5' exoribonuclease [Synechococcus phage MinM1]
MTDQPALTPADDLPSERPPLHVMLDIETMGTTPGSMIVAIGACTFDHPGQRGTFYARIEIEGQQQYGLTIDPGTALWWMRQDDAARMELQTADRLMLSTALCDLSHMLHAWTTESGSAELRLWANGANFDPVMLEAAWRARLSDAPTPWRYHEVRCARTLYDLAGIDRSLFPPRIPHHALEDALAQADAAEAALRILRQRKDAA